MGFGGAVSATLIPLDSWNDRWKREALLVRRRRIRRMSEMPHSLKVELAQELKYPHRIPVDIAELEVRYRRGSWWTINERNKPTSDDEYDDRVRYRSTTAWILRGEERVGAITFNEYELPIAADDEFYAAMDDYSAQAESLAEACCSCWEDFTMNVSAYGPVVELDSVWIKPRSISLSAWRPVLHELIRRLTRRCSILIMLPFPEEYAGRAGPETASRLGFRRRQDAMIRWCERHLGVERLPGEPGKAGWLWRPRWSLLVEIEEPEYDPNWHPGS